MKKSVMLSLVGLVCLLIGFLSFMVGHREISLIFTFTGIGIYLFKQIKKEKMD